MTCRGHIAGGRQASAVSPFSLSLGSRGEGRNLSASRQGPGKQRTPHPTPISSLAIHAAQLRTGKMIHDTLFLPRVCNSKIITLSMRKGFPCGSAGKESACNAGDLGLIPGLGKIPWRRERLPTPIFWSREFHGLYSSWGHKESDTIEQLSLSRKRATQPKKFRLGPCARAPYLPHLKSTAGTRTPSQSRRCSPRRCRTQRAGPGHRQAAGLWVQSGFQFGLGLGSVGSNSGHPGELPGESGGRRPRWGGRGMSYCRPRPWSFHCRTCAQPLG